MNTFVPRRPDHKSCLSFGLVLESRLPRWWSEPEQMPEVRLRMKFHHCVREEGGWASLSTNTMSSPPLTSFCLLFSPAQFHTLPPYLSKPISGIVKLIIAADCWESVTGSAALQSFILFCCEGSLTPSPHLDCEANWKGWIGALDEDKSAGSRVITPTSQMHEEDLQFAICA